ncbi:hypothetical protein AgCh_002630 [Apium graveolens]
MAGLSLYVGIIDTTIYVVAHRSTFWRIVKNGSTEEYESLPYICTLLNSSLWTYYGLIKPGELLVATVNGFGIIVEAVYVILFLIYAPKHVKGKTAILAGFLNFGFFGTAVLVTQLALEGEARTNAIGFLGAGLNIIMYGSPLAAMVPNGTGVLLGFIQLVLYGMYRNSKASKSVVIISPADEIEEGLQHEPLISAST